ncbi:hypothetical protein MCEGEM19_00335 [Candidatus Pelagibacterales bacterium]
MIKFRYLLIVFFINFFLKSTYSQACDANVSTERDCTGPLTINESNKTISNPYTISFTGSGSSFYYGINSSGSSNTITNLNTINGTVTSGYAYGIKNTGSNSITTNTGTINLTNSAGSNGNTYGILDTTGSNNTLVNSGRINVTSPVWYSHGLYSNSVNTNSINSGIVNAVDTAVTASVYGAIGFYTDSNNNTLTNTGNISATGSVNHGYAVVINRNFTLVNSSTISGTSITSFGIGLRDSVGGATITNSGTISGTSTSGQGYGIQLRNTITNTKITNTNTGIITGSTAGIINTGTGITITNSGTITGGTSSINNSGVINLTLNQGSKLIGTITNSGTLNITSNVGAAKSYAYSGTVTSLTDSNNRPSALGSAVAINIGSMEVSGENLYQKTANITDAVDRNIKNNKDTWVEPYYSESTRDSEGDSSQIRQFKNNKQGINAGFKVTNSAKPLQVIFNVDQTKNNIDSSEHIINSDGVMIGLMAPTYMQYEGYDVSVKGLVGYANSKTDRKILDNTSSTGERTLTGEYDSYYAVVGSALSKNYNLDKDLNANLTLGVDLTSEFRDSYNENLYFKYNSLELIQLQPRIQSEFIKTTGKDSNVFLTAGAGAREVLSGKTQKYSMNNTGVSFTAPNSGDYYASLAAGTNMNVAANVNFYALVSAKMSEKDTETYQASLGLKGTF